MGTPSTTPPLVGVTFDVNSKTGHQRMTIDRNDGNPSVEEAEDFAIKDLRG